ncbi:MAG TPA: methyltransferase domain-containing protein [Polyangiaceae bacterium]
MTEPEKPVSDPAYWEAAYRTDQTGWELGQAAPPLARALRTLPVGKAAVVLGSGRAHEVRAAAEAGWPRVVAVDFAPSAHAEAERLTAPELLPRIEWRRADLFELGRTDPEAFDLAIEHTSFCAIAPARREEWLASVAASLRPGGRLVALFYAHHKPAGPPFATTKDEIEALLPKHGFIIESIEIAPDSHPRRAGEELLTIARRS